MRIRRIMHVDIVAQPCYGGSTKEVNMDPVEVGGALGRLRSAAGLTQAQVAKLLSIDPSKISRIESGQFGPADDELSEFLKSLGTEEAAEFGKYIKRTWREVPAPGFWHPERPTIEAVEDCLTRLRTFEEETDLPELLKSQIQMIRGRLVDGARFLSLTTHPVALIGDIGVGKSTVLCLIAALWRTEDGLDLDQRPILEAGGGGVTVCEVGVEQGARWGILVDALPSDEVFLLAGDLCEAMWARLKGEHGGEKGVSKEVDRALRNMAGMARVKRKDESGKTKIHDPMEEFASGLPDLEALKSEFCARLRVWERVKREEWIDGQPDDATAFAWIAEEFRRVNNGRNPAFPFPARIRVQVPRVLLSKEVTVEFIDTKGIDGTSVRPDLGRYLTDARSVIVLCSRFNSAPDTSLQAFVEHAVETGLREEVAGRAGILVLPRADEWRAAKDDSGSRADTAAEGYELKADQISIKLQAHELAGLPVGFFDVRSDSPEVVRAFILDLVRRRRGHARERITAAQRDADYLFEHHKEVLESQVLAEVTRRLRIWSSQHASLPARVRMAHEAVKDEVLRSHARTVWASARRRGSWDNLDMDYLLGAGAAADARRRVAAPLGALKGVLENMMGDEQLAPAAPLVKSIKRAVRDWQEEFLGEVNNLGRVNFRASLRSASTLWAGCEGLYGTGVEYRKEVSRCLGAWFEDPAQQHLHDNLENAVQRTWKECVLDALEELLGSDDWTADG